MHGKRRLLALVLALCMTLSLLPMGALAEESNEVEPTPKMPSVIVEVSADGKTYENALVTLVSAEGDIVLGFNENKELNTRQYSEYNVYAPPGDYAVYVNGFQTGVDVAVPDDPLIANPGDGGSGEPEEPVRAHVDCYSVRFDLYESGAAAGSRMTAEYSAGLERPVIDGEKVPTGGVLTLKVDPRGADAYIYNWKFDSRNHYTKIDGVAATRLKGAAKVSCRVTGRYDAQSPYDAITLTYGDYTATKITNPAHGSGQADGVNTNEDNPANRINSYAWAMGSLTYQGETDAEKGLTRGNDYLYVGTNRNMGGTLLYMLMNLEPVQAILSLASLLFHEEVTNIVQTLGKDSLPELIYSVADVYFNGDLPQIEQLFDRAFLAALADETNPDNWVGQIVRVDPETDNTKVIYTDKERGSSYRACVEMNDALYFSGSTSDANSIVKVDEQENTSVIFSSTASGANTLRAGTVYDAKSDTLIYGGLVAATRDNESSRYTIVKEASSAANLVFLLTDDGKTTVIADAYTFYESGSLTDNAMMSMIASGGIWDICMYQGKVYVTMVEDRSFGVWCGEPAAGSLDANPYGWHWEKVFSPDSDAGSNWVVPEDVDDPLDLALLGIHSNMQDITATMAVYNDKLYLACFDNLPIILLKTLASQVIGLIQVTGVIPGGDVNSGNVLRYIYEDLYKYLQYNSSVYCFDGETFEKDEQFTQAVQDQNVEYLWRFQEANGDLYLTSADFEVLHGFSLPMNGQRIQYALGKAGVYVGIDYDALSQWVTDFLPALFRQDDGDVFLFEENSFSFQPDAAVMFLKELVSGVFSDGEGEGISVDPAALMNNEALMAFLSEQMEKLHAFLEENLTYEKFAAAIDGLVEKFGAVPITDELTVGDLLTAVDIPGLVLMARLRCYFDQNQEGFDLYKLDKDTNEWSVVFNDGLRDKYNYGGRTLAVCGDKLYVGTANPFYGAQVWSIEDVEATPEPEPEPEPTPTPGPSGGGGGGGTVQCVLTFETNGGSAVSPVTLARNSVVDLTKYTTTKAGYTFDGWYSDKGLTDKVTSVILSSSATVYAKWTKDEPAPSGERFVDVPKDAYYHDAVYWAVDKGVTEGVDETHFAPNGICTRAQMVTFLWRAAGQPAVSFANPFTDVSPEDYYYEAVLWGVSTGVVKGTSDTTFSPGDTVTRGQAVTFLYRYMGEKVQADNPFTDVTEEDYYYDAVMWAVANGVTEGATPTTFAPAGDCLRSHVVTFLNRALG